MSSCLNAAPPPPARLRLPPVSPTDGHSSSLTVFADDVRVVYLLFEHIFFFRRTWSWSGQISVLLV